MIAGVPSRARRAQGILILLSIVLSFLRHKHYLYVPALIGADLLQCAYTGRMGMEWLIERWDGRRKRA